MKNVLSPSSDTKISEVDCTKAESRMLAWAAPGRTSTEAAATATTAVDWSAGRNHVEPPANCGAPCAPCCSGCIGSCFQRKNGWERGIGVEQRRAGASWASGAAVQARAAETTTKRAMNAERR